MTQKLGGGGIMKKIKVGGSRRHRSPMSTPAVTLPECRPTRRPRFTPVWAATELNAAIIPSAKSAARSACVSVGSGSPHTATESGCSGM